MIINATVDNVKVINRFSTKIYCVSNVKDYAFNTVGKDSAYTLDCDSSCDSSCDSGNETQYFLFECDSNGSFGHWIIESACLIPIYFELKKVYPSLKLHIREKKKFKLIILEKLGVVCNDIDYELKRENVCFMPCPITGFSNKNDCKEHMSMVIKLFDLFRDRHSCVEKSIDTLLMPRQTAENYKYNDRKYDLFGLLSVSGMTILNTDDIKTFDEQIDLVLRAKNIIVTDGSPFLVNGLIAMNSNIVVIGNVTPNQMTKFSEMNEIVKQIGINNTIQRVYSDYSFNNVKKYLR